MRDGRPSATALSAARHRAQHQVLEGGVLHRDPLAVPILGAAESELRGAGDSGRRAMRWFICARSRLAEDQTLNGARHGLRQVVVLGAGLDTFGYRHGLRHLRVVEIDHPDTQRWKLSRLTAAGIDPTPVTHRAVDFEREDLFTTLSDLLDVRSPVLVWWLGVTPYLTVDAIRMTLAVLGRLPAVRLVLDHASPLGAIDPRRREFHERRRARAVDLGEPWLSEFRPGQLADELARAGFDRSVAVDERVVIRRALARAGNGRRDCPTLSTVSSPSTPPAPDTVVPPDSPSAPSTHLMLATRGSPASWA